MTSYKDKLRAKTLGRQNMPLTDEDVVPVVVNVEGEDLLFEIHRPTIAIRNRIFKDAGIFDDGDSSESPKQTGGALVPMIAAIYLAHTPRCEGTPERVYTRQDLDDLMNAQAGSYADALMMTALKVINSDPETVAGNSRTIPSGNSSSESPQPSEGTPTILP